MPVKKQPVSGRIYFMIFMNNTKLKRAFSRSFSSIILFVLLLLILFITSTIYISFLSLLRHFPSAHPFPAAFSSPRPANRNRRFLGHSLAASCLARHPSWILLLPKPCPFCCHHFHCPGRIGSFPHLSPSIGPSKNLTIFTCGIPKSKYWPLICR